MPVPEGWLPKLSRVLQNFETAVRENVTINGQPWEETSEGSELQSGMCCFPSVSCWVVLFWFLPVVFLMGQFSPSAVRGGKDGHGAGKGGLQLRCARVKIRSAVLQEHYSYRAVCVNKKKGNQDV